MTNVLNHPNFSARTNMKQRKLNQEEPQSEETEASKKDPTLPVRVYLMIVGLGYVVHLLTGYVGEATRKRAVEGCQDRRRDPCR